MSLFKRLLHDRETQRLFVVYVAIGGTTYLAYLGLAFALRRYIPEMALTVAYYASAATHFSLNRWVNFRQFDRAVHDQLRTFIAVLAWQWIVTLVIARGLTALHVPYFWVATIPVIVNLPLGFIATRYLTFGVGIVPRVMGLRKPAK